MALLERVATLLRANLNDLIEKAEDPEKTLKQLLLDMDNQLLQLKTQVAIALADQHMLEKKKLEHETKVSEWQRKAEMAVQKGDEGLARAALDRRLSCEQLAGSYAQQLDDQRSEAELLRAQYTRLRAKLDETTGRAELLAAERRRTRTLNRAGRLAGAEDKMQRTTGRIEEAILQTKADTQAQRSLSEEHSNADLEDRFRQLEREDRIEALLDEIKARPKRLLAS